MNKRYPIYTERAECRDCYKCVRECPVKAIKIEDAHAAVVESLCTLCGHCVNICPMNAKKIRNDLSRAQLLVQRKKKVYVSLAPSYRSEFAEHPDARIIAGLMRLGFAGVSETALGAEEVSRHVAENIAKKKSGLHISSACPAVVEYICKYMPQHRDNITQLLSPVLAHCRLLRATYGEDIGIVFVSPCIAKKKEADLFPHLLDLALTFEELSAWFSEAGIDIGSIEAHDESFVPRPTQEGALYPVDGGMIAGVKAYMPPAAERPFYMAVSGLEAITKTLHGVEELANQRPVFLELLACEGGCINGPCVREQDKTALKRYRVIETADYHDEKKDPAITYKIERAIADEAVAETHYTHAQIGETLRGLGKYTERDELNCSGCGYDSCRDLARALLDGRAEKTMCVSYMRKLAQKKAHALLKAIPAGVVIVDGSLQILECNRQFARLMGPTAEELFEQVEGLEGADLKSIFPGADLFETVLGGRTDSLEREVICGSVRVKVSIFIIEKDVLAGAIMQDVTAPSVQKDQVLAKSQEVIQKNLATVQKIAFLLGENAAESEVLLNSIIRSFAPEKVEGPRDGAH